MHLVTEIYSYTNNKARVKLDSGFTFALYKGEIRKYNIKENRCIDENVLSEIVENLLMKRAKERALFLIKDSNKTKRQIYEKLKNGYYPEIVIDNVISFLEKYSYIDDYQYALNYIDNNCKRKSAMRIKNELYTKGIDKNIIDGAFCELDIDEEASLSRLIESKIGRYNLKDAKDKQKFYAMLLRNGYSYDAIIREMRKVVSE